MRAQLNTKLTHIEALRTQLAQVNTNYKTSAAAVKSLLVARYKQAHEAKLKVLLNNDDIGTVQRNLKYYEYIMAASSALLTNRGQQVQALHDIESALKLEALKLRNLREQTKTHLDNLTESFESRARVAKSLEILLQTNKDALKQLRDDESELRNLVDDVTEETPPVTAVAAPFGALKGKLAWPTAGRIAKAPGGAMRDGGAKWSGVIIESDPGSEVASVAAGRVAFADWFRNFGLLIIIDHGDGYMSLYGHNQELFKQNGDMVEAGEIVASVGDTGGRSTTGLYFEIRQRGRAADPRQWCKK
jgi:septal ring factor EnvC (AmiA/AmiB activator)